MIKAMLSLEYGRLTISYYRLMAISLYLNMQ